jgi:hypothetical protein
LQRKPQEGGTGYIVRINRCRIQLATDREKIDGNQLWLWSLPPRPEGKGKPMLGGGLRREGEPIISDEGVRESGHGLRRPKRGLFAGLPPPTRARPESHMRLGEASPTRPTHAA